MFFTTTNHSSCQNCLQKHGLFSLIVLIFSTFVVSTGCTKVNDRLNTLTENTDALQSGQLRAIAPKPNIILILGDDVGYEIPSVNGGQSYSTPNLDRMAAQGMRFTQCHSTPICSPSRFQIMTGKYNFRNYNLWGVMDTTNNTFADVLRDGAGYKTLVCGKWQLSGGDTAIRALGFDNYMVWNPYTSEAGENVDGKGSRYKDPIIFKNGAFLPDAETSGKFGDDMFTDYIKTFIDSNLGNPFFVYYPICLVHKPFSPTPQDPAFATWDPKGYDISYFPSMVNYMDRKVGEIIRHLRTRGIAENTIVLFVGDNGTTQDITSMFNGQPFQGGKGLNIEAGTHVPLIALWPGVISPGSVNNDLIDFSDFLPTMADIAQVSVPASYGFIDGVSFAPRLKGEPGTPRDWIYCFFYPNPVKRPGRRDAWIQNKTYKLYDELSKPPGKFYNIVNDPKELNSIRNSQLTQQEKQVKAQLNSAMSALHN